MKIALAKTYYVKEEEIDFSQSEIDREAFLKMEPFRIENIDIFLNQYGQLGIHFDTPNHKYLDIDYGLSSSIDEATGENSEFWSRGLAMESPHLVYDLHLYFNVPVFTATLYLIPENREEKTLLDGYIVVRALKYEYEILFIPYSDFLASTRIAEKEELEEDHYFLCQPINLKEKK